MDESMLTVMGVTAYDARTLSTLQAVEQGMPLRIKWALLLQGS